MNKFIKNSTLYIITTLVLNASSFLLLPLYTRLLSPEDFGNIYIVQTIASVISVIASLQIHGSISKYYYSYKSDSNKVKKMYTSIIIFIFLFSSAIYLLIILFNKKIFFFIDIEFYPYIFIALLTSYFQNFFNIILSLLYVEEKANTISVLSILIGIGSILLTIIFVLRFDNKIYGFLLSKLLAAIAQFVVFLLFSRKYILFTRRLFGIKEYIGYSVQRLPIGLSNLIVSFSDRFIVYGYFGAYENGVYSTGYKLGQAPDMLFHSINSAYVPYVYDKYSNPTDENNRKLINIAQYLFSLYLLVTFIIIVFSKEFINLLDERYNDSLIIMIIIMLSYGINGIRYIFQCPFDFIKKYGKVKSVIWISSSLLNVLLNIILIPIYGIYGAAFATFISYIIVLPFVLYYSNKAIKINYNYRLMFKVLLVSLFYLPIALLEISILNLSIKIIISCLYIYFILKINNITLKNFTNLIKGRVRK